MSCSYVCSSCRRQLVGNSIRPRCAPRSRQASFISFNGRPTPHNSTQLPAVDGKREPLRPEKRNFERQVPSQYDRSVEDDFLERLFESRDPSDLGPYSKGPHSKRREERETSRQQLLAEKQQAEKDTKEKAGQGEASRRLDELQGLHYAHPTVRLKSSLAIPYYKSNGTPSDGLVTDPLFNGDRGGQAEVSSISLSKALPRRPPHLAVLNLIDGTPSLRSTIRIIPKRNRLRTRSDMGGFENSGTRLQCSPKLSGIEESAPAQAAELPVSPDIRVDVEGISEVAGDLKDQILSPTLTLDQSFKACLKLHSDKNSARVDIAAADIERRLLQRITVHFSDAAGPARKKPSPLEALSKFKLSYRAYVTLWQETMWSLIAQIIPVLVERSERPSETYVDRHIHEIAELWKHFLARKSAVDGLSKTQHYSARSTSTTWDSLSESEHMAALRGWSNKDFAARFFQFFGKQAQPTLAAIPGIDTAALASFVIFRRHVRSTPREASASSKACAPFMRFMSQLMPYSTVADEISKHKSVLATHCLDTTDVQSTVEDLKEITSNAVSIYAEINAAVSPVARGLSTVAGGESRQVRTEMFKKRISRALEKQNIPRLEALWREVQTAFNETATNGDANSIPSNVYAHFLMAFMALRRPNRAIDVWNHMMENNVPVTVGTWDAMLKGCAKAKDPKGLEAMWQKMLQSGMRPDAQVFATRIHGLTTTGYWETGMRVFQDMIKTWLGAVTNLNPNGQLLNLASIGDVEGAPKPNSQCLNSLVLGLARGRKHEQLAQVISWARAIGIKADVYTFNPLFRLALNEGNMEQATRVLQQMSNSGINPDIASFTMLLESLFREDDVPFKSLGDAANVGTDTANLNADLKHDAAMSIFKEMERAGIEANAWSFATLINGLLKSAPNYSYSKSRPTTSSSGNLRAAHMVLAHMSANSIPLSSQIYTALISYHFSLDPPDLAAIESLWNRAKVDRQVFLDVVFFDRLIEGLAGANEIGRMMTALGQAGKRGKVPGWIAMKEVVAALRRVGDWDRIDDVVDGVRLEEQGNRDDIRAREGRREFWDLIESMGLAGPQGFGTTQEQQPGESINAKVPPRII